MILSIKVMRVISLLSLLAVLLPTALGGGDCERGRTWWHRQRGVCLPCTHCDPRRLAVRYPCEPHRDTVCQPLYEVRIWPFNTDNDTDYDYYDYTDYSDVSDDTTWDIQTSTLTMAVTGCVVFFVVVLTLSLYHAKQWRVLKHALKSDVQDLSAKLKLMEAGGEAPGEPVSNGHIYCNIHVGKNALLGSAATKKGLGNVYTQEKHIT